MFPADLVTFTEEILNGKRYVLYSVRYSEDIAADYKEVLKGSLTLA